MNVPRLRIYLKVARRALHESAGAAGHRYKRREVCAPRLRGLAEFERDLIRERTHAGLAAARARGRLFGRPKALTPKKVAQLRTLAKDDQMGLREICQTLGIFRATFYRYVKN